MNGLQLYLPPIVPGAPEPKWHHGKFYIGNEIVTVLEYESNLAGWNDDLTSFHEENAGENHFIDQASRRHVISQLDRYLTISQPTILEIGCSSGYMLSALQIAKPDAQLIGSDIVYKPLLQLAAKIPNVPLLRFDLLNCPLPNNSVDAVILLNMLEHIEDDISALRQIHRILKPGGISIIEVPAGPHLYDAYDKVLLHFRRYKLKNLKNLVQKLHFKVVKKSHLGCFIYPGFWIVKQRHKRFLLESAAKQQHTVEKNIRQTGSSKLLHRLMNIELLLGNWLNYPFGIRCLLTCIK